MFKNKRPYTNENGYEDAELITDCQYEDIMKVSEWIKMNIEPSKSVWEHHSSYGLKHFLQHDTGIYLTNNQFKDAMYLAGYIPVDPDELNWLWKINLIKNSSKNPFIKYCINSLEWHYGTGYLREKKSGIGYFGGEFCDEYGRHYDDEIFVYDATRDLDFPVFADKEIIRKYLNGKRACEEAINAFEGLWLKYEHNYKRKYRLKTKGRKNND